jgi:class 3 adenylate cyclase
VTFRLKIFLAMLALVVGVTGVSFWLAVRSIRGSFDAIQSAQLDEREASLRRLRDARAAEVRRLMDAYAQSVRLFAAFIAWRDSPDSESAENLYDMARAELLKAGAITEGWRLALFDAKGDRIPGAGRLPETMRLEWNPAASAMRRVLASEAGVSGLIALPDGGGLAECFVSPIDDRAEGRLGVALLAVPLLDSGGALLAGMHSGILVNARLYGDGLPPEARQAIEQNIAAGGSGELEIGGVPYRVFSRRLAGGDPARFFPDCWQITAVSLEPSLREQRALKQKLLLAGGAAIPLVLIAAGVLSSGLAAPVRALVAATKRIGAGDYSATIRLDAPRELGQLAEAFNEMSRGLALKETYRSLLDLVSDPRIAESLLKEGLELGGEDRDVTVLFCDICGFTKLSESRSPCEVIAILNEHFTPLTQVVVRHGGVVLHFVGDMLIGLFGAPTDLDDHPLRAAACALDLVRERSRLNEGADVPIEVSVGIASGHVVAGRMGSRDRLIYSVIGARVNLAARLCSHAGARQIIVDGETLARIGPAAKARALGEVSLKGISAAVPIHEILAVEPVPASSVNLTASV